MCRDNFSNFILTQIQLQCWPLDYKQLTNLIIRELRKERTSIGITPVRTRKLLQQDFVNPTPRIALFVGSSVRPSVTKKYMHHTYMQASGSRSRIIDMCIIYTCIRVKVQDHNRYVHHGHMYQGQEHVHRTCIQTSGSRIIHTCMLQDHGPGS